MREREKGGGTCRRTDTGASEIAKTHTVRRTHTLSHTTTARATSGSMEKDGTRTAKICKIEDRVDRLRWGLAGIEHPMAVGVCHGCARRRSDLIFATGVSVSDHYSQPCTALRVTCDERTGVGVCDGKPHTCELLGENLLGGGVACRHDAVQCSSGVSIYRRSLSSSLLFSRSRHNFVKRTSSRPLHTPRVQRSRSQTPSRQALQNEQEHANGRRAVPCEVTPRHE
jgi:hypothetical protein